MANGSASPEVLENLKGELRRGCLIVAVLAQLRVEQYGYTLRKALADDGLEIDEGTLYPLLRRLETQGLLVSQWREEDKRNKRFYRLSEDGVVILKQLLEEWESINSSLGRILVGLSGGHRASGVGEDRQRRSRFLTARWKRRSK